MPPRESLPGSGNQEITDLTMAEDAMPTASSSPLTGGIVLKLRHCSRPGFDLRRFGDLGGSIEAAATIFAQTTALRDKTMEVETCFPASTKD